MSLPCERITSYASTTTADERLDLNERSARTEQIDTNYKILYLLLYVRMWVFLRWDWQRAGRTNCCIDWGGVRQFHACRMTFFRIAPSREAFNRFEAYQRTLCCSSLHCRHQSHLCRDAAHPARRTCRVNLRTDRGEATGRGNTRSHRRWLNNNKLLGDPFYREQWARLSNYISICH